MQREWSVGGRHHQNNAQPVERMAMAARRKARERRVDRLDGQFYAASRAKVVKADVFGHRTTFSCFVVVVFPRSRIVSREKALLAGRPSNRTSQSVRRARI